ncbi:MAG: NYN domain-containing protein [Nanoarchaeota archaeon]|nr:NYN domain-containing protein [Nanoarchaeota archaeon]
MNKQKVSIYIDGQNFYQGVVDNFFNEKHCKQKVNFYEIQDGFDLAEFCYHLVQGQDLDLIYYFDGRLNGRLFSSRAIANQKRFFKKLEGYLEVRVELGQIQGNESVKYQKGVDVRLATYLIRDAHRNKYNMAYLLSSDKDFCPAVEYIQGF